MVGLSMALTIAVCIGSFVWIYAKVEPLTRDFVDAATIAPTEPSRQEREADESAESDDDTPTREAAAQVSERGNRAEPRAENPTPTPTPQRFRATHRVISEVTINFRPGPGVNSGEPVAQLEPGTELQYLNETQDSQDPDADGDLRWLKFRTEDGLEGWIREIDVEPINTGQ